ncbi:YihY/virulence factor BrkB family protein [Nocardia sp. BMG111209]|uniref:YihY/virulence factor BrkB family protein n=1 Tax=Nocardia sp. BMG111209 TaxID=1160137 RepID=UPI0003A39ABE|nr:YihY/virulence factor BrkB family protein [Nocardia sp. BMG111209]
MGEQRGEHPGPEARGDAPVGPSDLSRQSWCGVLRRSVRRFRENNLTDWAAALTYYSVLSLFPGLIVLTGLLSALGRGATDSLIDTVRRIGPGSGTALLIDAVHQLQGARSFAGVVAVIGIVSALWSASSYLGAFMRAVNAIYGTAEGRPIWQTFPLRIALTVVVLILITVTAAAVSLTGSLARRVGDWLGWGSAAVAAWNIAKWPVLIVVVTLLVALLYWAAPNARQLGFRWLSPGSVLAVVVWVVASIGFTLYATHFGSYNKVYGSLAGAIVLLIWLWLTNIAILLGAQVDAELARGRQIERGQHPDTEPVLPRRAEPGD